jgi:hypothetical protein
VSNTEAADTVLQETTSTALMSVFDEEVCIVEQKLDTLAAQSSSTSAVVVNSVPRQLNTSAAESTVEVEQQSRTVDASSAVSENPGAKGEDIDCITKSISITTKSGSFLWQCKCGRLPAQTNHERQFKCSGCGVNSHVSCNEATKGIVAKKIPKDAVCDSCKK